MGRYKIEIKASAVKEINKLPSKDLKKILKKIESLSDNPRPVGAKKLSQQESYRIRYGIYRIVYIIKDKVLIVYVIKIGQRKEVYRQKR